MHLKRFEQNPKKKRTDKSGTRQGLIYTYGERYWQLICITENQFN